MLLTWLKSKFAPEKKEEDDPGVYTPQERLIFSYHNGEKLVRGDPLVLYKKIMAVSVEFDIDLKMAESQLLPVKEATKAHDNVVKRIREIFNIKGLGEEEGGLSELETLLLLERFFAYTASLKKNSSLYATFSTFCPRPTSSSASQATPSFSVSGSTAEDSSTAAPPPSPTEPASASAP